LVLEKEIARWDLKLTEKKEEERKEEKRGRKEKEERTKRKKVRSLNEWILNKLGR